MKKILLLLFLSACTNPMCFEKGVDNYTFDQCIKERMYVPDRMGVVPKEEIDACSYKAYQAKQQLCGGLNEINK